MHEVESRINIIIKYFIKTPIETVGTLGAVDTASDSASNYVSSVAGSNPVGILIFFLLCIFQNNFNFSCFL